VDTSRAPLDIARPTYAAAWDAEYARGRYADDPPIPFVEDIIATVTQHGVLSGRAVDIGCGNGRNLVGLLGAGLDPIALDVSEDGLRRLPERSPRTRRVLGTVAALRERSFDVVVGIQVFQHGDEETAIGHLRAAAELVADGGLLCVRVNAIGTDVWPDHEVMERDPTGSFTVRYLAGAKAGLPIHFFSEEELRSAVPSRFTEILALRLDETRRERPARGSWFQWEGIWRRPA
jgi:SAM-dependent methyltransferase